MPASIRESRSRFVPEISVSVSRTTTTTQMKRTYSRVHSDCYGMMLCKAGGRAINSMAALMFMLVDVQYVAPQSYQIVMDRRGCSWSPVKKSVTVPCNWLLTTTYKTNSRKKYVVEIRRLPIMVLVDQHIKSRWKNAGFDDRNVTVVTVQKHDAILRLA
jgi:hypothetical protein